MIDPYAIRRFLGLRDEDLDLIEKRRAHFEAVLDELGGAFYRRLLACPETAGKLGNLAPERLQALRERQTAHARRLLFSRLSAQWLEENRKIGHSHYRLAIEPLWIAGAYNVYAACLEKAAQSVPPPERSRARSTISRLIASDLMALLDGYWEAARKADEELILDMHERSLRDPLTALPNRLLFSERLASARAQSRRGERPLAAGMLDIDGLKQVNDLHGHAAGDELLVEVARRVRRVLRAGDTLARLGGDEFGLLLTSLDRADDVGHICDRILQELRAPFEIHGEHLSISGSLGVTVYPLDDAEPDILMRNVDRALYAAKQGGRDQWVLYDPALEVRVREYARVRTLVSDALGEGSLRLYYQPIVKVFLETAPAAAAGVEALLRLPLGGGEMLPAADFAELLDHVRFARPIGRFVLDAALAQGEAWHREGHPLTIAVNISARHLLDAEFQSDLVKALACHPGIGANYVVLELTERTPLQDFETAIRRLDDCRRLGVRISIDDFGAGSASLSYLQRLPVQMVKIDRSFIQALHTDPKSAAIAKGIITAAHMLGIRVVAEGVETPEQFGLLVKMECDYAQGYAIGRPMPAAEIPPWIAHAVRRWSRWSFGER